jgi:RNA methyltransferase, TrmH family
MSRTPFSNRRKDRRTGPPGGGKPARGSDAAPTREPSARRFDSSDEQKFHGRHACHALFARRRDDLIRVYLLQERVKEFGEVLSWCAAQKRAYHIVEPENLERLAETVHHQGIVILAKKVRSLNDSDMLNAVQRGQLNGPLLYLDGVQNPHNLGSILRTAAHFGAAAVLGAKDQLPGVTASAARVAEGGAETVVTARLTDPRAVLSAMKQAGYQVLAATSHPGGNVYSATISDRCVIVLGNEVHGVSPEILPLANGSLQIPGTGAVESLNVAVACGVLLSEVARRRSVSSTGGQTPAPPHRPPTGGRPGKSPRARSRSR